MNLFGLDFKAVNKETNRCRSKLDFFFCRKLLESTEQNKMLFIIKNKEHFRIVFYLIICSNDLNELCLYSLFKNVQFNLTKTAL